MAAPLIDHEAATREIAKGLELTTRLHSLLKGGNSSGQLESLSQEIMQALVAALSILMMKPSSNPNSISENKNRSSSSNNNDNSKLAVAVAEPGESTVTTTTAVTTTTVTPTARVRLSNPTSAVVLDIGLGCPGREEDVTAGIPHSESINNKNDRKRYQFQSKLLHNINNNKIFIMNYGFRSRFGFIFLELLSLSFPNQTQLGFVLCKL